MKKWKVLTVTILFIALLGAMFAHSALRQNVPLWTNAQKMLATNSNQFARLVRGVADDADTSVAMVNFPGGAANSGYFPNDAGITIFIDEINSTYVDDSVKVYLQVASHDSTRRTGYWANADTTRFMKAVCIGGLTTMDERAVHYNYGDVPIAPYYRFIARQLETTGAAWDSCHVRIYYDQAFSWQGRGK